jgi:hypothetical protein
MNLTRSFSALVMTLVCVLALSVLARADTITFTATLSGSQEVPPVNVPGFGSAVLVLDDVTGVAVIAVSYTNLSSGITMGHIHGPAPAGVNAGIIQGFTSQLVLGSTTGGFSNFTFPVALTAAQITALKNGLVYVNLHTSAFPGGELRGQLTIVPEPGTFLLLGAGLVSVAGALRKRRQRER